MQQTPLMPRRAVAARASRTCGALLVALTGLHCADSPLVAPIGSSLKLSSPATVIAAEGGTTTVSALLTEEDGVPAENGTQILFLATGGDLCVQPTSGASGCLWSTIVTAKTQDGIAYVLARAGSGPTMKVDANSGKATQSTTLTVSSVVAPAGAKSLVESDPDTVSAGAAARVTAFVTTADGSPVPNATRVVFRASSGILSRGIVLTQDGFASTTLTAPASAVSTVVSLGSGALRDSVIVVVQ